MIYGINAVLEAIARRACARTVQCRERAGARAAAAVVGGASRRGSRFVGCATMELDRAARGGVHQGVIADVEEARDYSTWTTW